MSRRMGDEDFREDQWTRRYDAHIAPVNRYVDEIRELGHGWAPYVAPLHGGLNARVLSILRDPGPATQDGLGSGFLCVENADDSAALQCDLLDKAGLSAQDMLPWNAYPWYINRSPTTAEMRLGIPTIVTLIDLCPSISELLLQGNEAKWSWRALRRTRPDLVEARSLVAVESYHPSRQALFARDPAERHKRAERRETAFKEVAQLFACAPARR